MKTWTAPGQCSTCRFCAMDMDMSPFCTHPTVRANPQHQFGAGLNTAIREFCGEELRLREPREEKRGAIGQSRIRPAYLDAVCAAIEDAGVVDRCKQCGRDLRNGPCGAVECR